MSDKIEISDQKQVHVEFNQEFDDVDLLSDVEREALNSEIDDDPPTEAEQKLAEGKAAEAGVAVALDVQRRSAQPAGEEYEELLARLGEVVGIRRARGRV